MRRLILRLSPVTTFAMMSNSSPLTPVTLALCMALPLFTAAGCSESTPSPAPAADAAPSTESAPQAERTSWFDFDRERHDFGDVYQAAVRHTRFDLVAAGSEPTIVTALKRSCGCTEGELFVLEDSGAESPVQLDHPYAPGTEFRLLASLNSKGRQGTQEQRVHIVTQGNITTSFILDAEIVTFLELDPPSLQLPDGSSLGGLESELVRQEPRR